MYMHGNRIKIAKWVFITCFLVLFCIAQASALSIQGTKYMGSISPGGTDTFPMTLEIGSDENPADITIDVMGFGQDLDKGYTPLKPESDANPNSARTFITLDKTLIHAAPGTPQKVTATISLPKNAGAGGKYALIYIKVVPTKEQSVTTAQIVPVFITIAGTQPMLSGSITHIEAGDMTPGQPIAVTTSLKNTGNYHYYNTVNQVKILDAKGNSVSDSKTAPSSDAVIPGNTVQYVLKPDAKNLQPGTYTIDSKILLENGVVLDEKTTPFTVKADYVPPITASSITLTPGSAGTLTSPDGRYSISFPQGAVLGEAAVSLKPYARENLPEAPANAKLGATSFEVTGLSGLLSKEATVQVTYSAEDLAAAGGDTTKLKLAYYDAAQNAWVILPTKVNSGSTSMTTTTNHLSVWAVLVSSSTSGGTPSGAARASATQSPVPLTLILASLIIAVIAAGYRARKWK